MENKTAVEFLKYKLPSLFEHDGNGFYESLFAKALELEKQQIIDAYTHGSIDFPHDLSEQYYSETYKKPTE